jgi:(p)ppGpp synthase/HD superfamily hydrolase
MEKDYTYYLFDAPSIIWRAYSLAKEAHKDQFRRDGTTRYISHPTSVETLLQKENDSTRIAALLHDVLEDTTISETDLYIVFPKDAIDAVVILTHKKGESYEEYLKKVKENKIACKVKIADMLHNLSCEPTQKQISKYLKGLEFLMKD